MKKTTILTILFCTLLISGCTTKVIEYKNGDSTYINTTTTIYNGTNTNITINITNNITSNDGTGGWTNTSMETTTNLNVTINGNLEISSSNSIILSSYNSFFLNNSYYVGSIDSATLGTGSTIVTTLGAYPFVYSKEFPTREIGFRVATANTTYTSCSIAIYDDSSTCGYDHYPTNKITQYENVSFNTTGFKNTTIDSITLVKDTLYWGASSCNNSNTNVKINAINSADIMPVLGYTTTGTNANIVMRDSSYNYTNTGGILPSTFPCGGTPVNSVANAIYMKYG